MTAIPTGITRKDVLAALKRLDRREKHPFGPSTKFDLVYEGKRYPPKAVVGLAAERLAGKPLRPTDFSGGKESQCNRILENLGFRVEEKPRLGEHEEWRGAPESAKAVFDAVFEDVSVEVRLRWETYLAESIEYAMSRYPDRSVVILEPSFVATTVGMVRCLAILDQDDLIVLLDKAAAPTNTRWSGGKYEYAPGCEEAYVSRSSGKGVFDAIREAHFRAIDACGGAHAGNSQRRRAHSPGVLRYLETVVGRSLPDPSYAPRAVAGAGVDLPKPSFWWVNHKQTHRQEIDGEYLWSPKKNQNGAKNATYDNMTKAMAGDVVFSFAGGEIRAVGVAKGRAKEAAKPTEFGATGDQWGEGAGWKLPVQFVELARPLRAKDHAKDWAGVLPEKHSPIRASGDGNQGVYLAAVPEEMAGVVRRLLGAQYEAALERVRQDLGSDLEDEAAEQVIEQRTDIGPTTKATLVNARRGQGIYRQNLERIEKGCRVTGITDGRYLRASHIKPWCKSDDFEKLDGNNGLLLSPNADHLFDGGFISFADDGALLVSKNMPEDVLQAMGLKRGINVGQFKAEQCKYLEWHRKAYGLGSSDPGASGADGRYA